MEPETIVGGTTRARERFPELFDAASRGRPVTIVSGERQVMMLARSLYLEILRRLEIAEETAAMLADTDVLRKLRESQEDIGAGRGVSPDDAERLLGLEE